MSEAPLPNDAAARSPTGEILDASTPPATPPSTPQTPESTPPKSPDGQTSSTTPSSSEPPKTPEPKPTEGAPETYAEFKAPDGYTIDKTTLEAATPIFKELGLTQDQAQRLVDFHTGQMIEAAKAAEAPITAMAKNWAAETAADPDMKAYARDGKIGIEAVQIDIAAAKASLDPALRAEFERVMDWTGIGNNPAFVKALWKFGQALGEGRPVAGGGPSPHGQTAPGAPKPSPAKALYPNLP